MLPTPRHAAALITAEHQQDEQGFVWRSTITKRRLPQARKAIGQFGER
jgi:hypothetical protein